MSAKVPRVTIQADYESGHELGKVNTLSLGYGLHQAWVYASMFGTASVFGLSTNASGSALTPVFTYSVIAYAICLLFFGIFDQQVLSALVKRRTATVAAGCMLLGTLLILPSATPGFAGLVLCIVSGILTGVGSATLIAFWGTAFARYDGATILINTALAIFISVLVYAVLLHLVPAPYSGVLAALLPVCELLVLLKHTPVPYMERHEVPLFNPLPVNRARFVALLGLPMLCFGFVLGFMRLESVVSMIARTSLAAQIPLLLSAGVAAVLIVVVGYIIIDDERPNVLLRPLLPLIAVSMLFIPLTQQSTSMVFAVVVLAGYMCLEGLVWILLGTMAQRFRISPVHIFGIGRGSIAVGMLVAFALNPAIQSLFQLPAYDSIATVVVMLIALVGAFAFMPHESDIRRAVLAGGANEQTVIDILNIKSESEEPQQIQHELEARAGAEQPNVSSVAQAESGTPAQPAEAAGAAPSLFSAQASNQESADSQSVPGGLFRKKCERIANRYLLSAREAEVLFFLAKGYNAAGIMEKLYISEGTAKTHIRHIYNKTDVHTQQELMRMVADEWID